MQSLHNREITSRNKRIAERNKIKPLKLPPNNYGNNFYLGCVSGAGAGGSYVIKSLDGYSWLPYNFDIISNVRHHNFNYFIYFQKF